MSRPASFNPLISFLNEAVMTFMFLFLVNLMTARWAPAGLLNHIVTPLYRFYCSQCKTLVSMRPGSCLTAWLKQATQRNRLCSFGDPCLYARETCLWSPVVVTTVLFILLLLPLLLLLLLPCGVLCLLQRPVPVPAFLRYVQQHRAALPDWLCHLLHDPGNRPHWLCRQPRT